MGMVVKTTAARMAKGRDPQSVPTQSRHNDERSPASGALVIPQPISLSKCGLRCQPEVVD
jgi:hypothetical protein